MKSRVWLAGVALLILLVVSVGVGYPLYVTSLQSRELSLAYEQYLTTLAEAQIHLNPVHLGEVAVSPRLEAAVRGIEERKGFTEIVSEEYGTPVVVKIVKFTPTEAIAEMRYDYRQFSQSFAGGTRYYGLSQRWYWRLDQVTFIKDNGVWKVKETHFVDWSG